MKSFALMAIMAVNAYGVMLQDDVADAEIADALADLTGGAHEVENEAIEAIQDAIEAAEGAEQTADELKEAELEAAAVEDTHGQDIAD